jgi:subfamily B ATP-binding cassette protein MsbA
MDKKSDTRLFARLFIQFFRPYWRASMFIVVVYVVAGVVKGLQPLAFAPLISAFTKDPAPAAEHLHQLTLNNLAPTLVQWFHMDPSHRGAMIMFSIVAYVALAILWACLTTVGYYFMLRTKSCVARDMMLAVHRHLIELPMGFFNNRKSGDVVSRLSNDVNHTAAGVDAIVRGLVQSAAEMVLYTVILIRTDPLLSVVVIAMGSVHLVITRLLARRARNRTAKKFRQTGFMSHLLLETVQGMRIIKSFAGERFTIVKVREAAEALRRRLVREQVTMFVEVPLRHMLDAVIVCAALGCAYQAMSAGRLATGGLILFVGVTVKAIEPVSAWAKQMLQLHSTAGGAVRILELLNARNDMPDGDVEPQILKDRIELRNVTFAYDPQRPVLQNVNLTICRGEKVALVGPSGAGKTTMSDLLLRFYDVSEGAILYDGVDIRRFKQRSYRRLFGVVPQESHFFLGSIRDMVVYSRELDAKALDHAMDVANAREFVEALPAGLDTMAGEQGVKLSGGQRQRLAIARAVYARPSILILDEATSSLDSESERQVQEAISRVLQSMTAIVIAHRLSTVVQADKIVVLNHFGVEAVGRHEELLESSVTYRHLYNLQFRDSWPAHEKSAERSPDPEPDQEAEDLA